MKIVAHNCACLFEALKVNVNIPLEALRAYADIACCVGVGLHPEVAEFMLIIEFDEVIIAPDGCW